MPALPSTDPAEASREPSEAEHIAAEVAAVAEVAGLHGGAFGEVATYLPGRRVRGIRFGDDGTVAVHVTAAWPLRLPALAAGVRAAVTTVTPRPVTVRVEDLALPEDDTQQDSTQPAPAGRSRPEAPAPTAGATAAGSTVATGRSTATGYAAKIAGMEGRT